MVGFPKAHFPFVNRESHREFDFWLPQARRRPGVSALVRVRNEARKIRHCLLSIAGHFDEIVVVDNASTDRTRAIVDELGEDERLAGRLRVFSYPFRLARFGPEHDATPEDSVHSAVYFSNWALARCAYRFICKWDGDMVLVRSARRQFRDFLNRVQDHRDACWMLRGQTVYREPGGTFRLAIHDVNEDVEVFPNRHECRFVKHRHWEAINRPQRYRLKTFDPVCFYELKYVDEDEFDHWSTTEWPSERKRREWRNFWAVKEGRAPRGEFETLPAAFLDEEIGPDPDGPRTDWQRLALKTLPWFAARQLRRWKERSPWPFRRALRPTDTFLVGHPKSGNTWLAYMLAVVFANDLEGRVHLANVGDFVPFVHGDDWRIAQFPDLPDPRVFRNEFPLHWRHYPRVIYLYRDPRAVIVSFWHMYRVMFDRELPLADFVAQYLGGDGCFEEWNAGLVRWDRQLEFWHRRAAADDSVLLLRYEDLVERREAALRSVCAFLGLDVAPALLDAAVQRGDLDSMKRLETAHGAEAYKGRAKRPGRFVRTGTADGWRAELDAGSEARIRAEMAPAMALAGYLDATGDRR